MAIRKVNFGFGTRNKRVGKTKYKYVYEFKNDKGKAIFVASVSNRKGLTNFNGTFDTDTAAAKAVDVHFIQNGKSPVNILKKK